MRRVVSGLLLVPVLACGVSEDPRAASSTGSKAALDRPTVEPTVEPTDEPTDEEDRRDPSAAGDETSAPVDPVAAALADSLDSDAFAADLRFIAAARPPGSSHWQAVQDRCATSLEAAGFSVERVGADGAGVSVVGYLPGRDPSLPAVVVGAHYDHIADCAGADDNASGTAAALAIARTLATHEGSWERSVYVACWDEEESGLHGSRHWVDRAIADGERFAVYLNFDAIGYADSTPGNRWLAPSCCSPTS